VKILFLSSWYPNRLNPHLGNFVQRHADAVSKFNDVASLYVSSDPNLTKKFDIEIKRINDVFTVNVYYKKVKDIFIIGLWMKYFRLQKAYRAGYNEVVKYFNSKPDVVHLNVAYPAGLFAMKLKKESGIPYVITEHSTKYHLTIDRPETYLTKKICNGAELICPVSEDLGKVMKTKGFAKNFEVVPNVVDINTFRIADKKQHPKTKIIHISTLLEWQKNISGMLRIIKKLSETRTDFELNIISEKDSTGAIALAKQLGLPNSIVQFYPDQPIEKVAEMLRGSDVLLLFSNFENSPCVIIEALASGVPVVSSNVGGISELINSKNGLLVNAKDEDALYEKLNTMLNEHKTFDKEEMRKNAIGKFSYDVVGKKFTDIYRRVLSSG